MTLYGKPFPEICLRDWIVHGHLGTDSHPNMLCSWPPRSPSGASELRLAEPRERVQSNQREEFWASRRGYLHKPWTSVSDLPCPESLHLQTPWSGWLIASGLGSVGSWYTSVGSDLYPTHSTRSWSSSLLISICHFQSWSLIKLLNNGYDLRLADRNIASSLESCTNSLNINQTSS